MLNSPHAFVPFIHIPFTDMDTDTQMPIPLIIVATDTTSLYKIITLYPLPTNNQLDDLKYIPTHY